MTEKTEEGELKRLIEHFGSKAHLAAELGVTTVAVDKWLLAGRLPPARAIQVQRITEGEFKALDLA